jgi:nicotinamidase-related amidase
MLEIKKSSLVIVDVQSKLANLMDNKEPLFANVEILIKTAKALEIPILWCQQNPKGLGPTLPQIAELLDGDEPIDKFSFSCCGDENFVEQLKKSGRKQIILCGIETHVCIYQTAMDLLDRDYEVNLVADAVSSRSAENKHIALQRLSAEGAYMSSTEMTIFELLKTAKHPKFKELAKLIR